MQNQETGLKIQTATIPVESIQAWFFDLDGTLMDTDDQAVESMTQRLRFLGPIPARKLARYLIMKSETPLNAAVTLVDMLGFDVLLLKMRKKLQRHQVKPTFRIIEGIKPMLEKLQERGKLVVVSTRPHDDAVAFLKQHKLENLFTLVVSQETTNRLKPHPDPVLHAAKTLGLTPNVCAMAGDTTVDIRSARRAGAWAVGVLCGFGEEAELRRSGAHLILPTTAELHTYVLLNGIKDTF